MGTLVGHVAPGFAFLALGLWHLFNHIKLHAQQPNSYTSPPWFPTSKLRYIELFLIMVASSISVSMELVIGPEKHTPFDPDGTIPSNHLHNLEHSSISMTFFVYALFAIILDKVGPKAQYGLTQLIASLAFGQQLFLFHLHSADHMGVEGQYHLLLQIAIVVSLATTLMGIGLPKSFMVSFVRSASIMFQGVWLILMGYMLWTPELIPKGCFINLEEDHQVVRCHSEEALHRAKSLVNIQFSWLLIAAIIFVMSFYLVLVKFYGEKVEYTSLTKEELLEEDYDDVESQKKTKVITNSTSFIHIGKGYAPMDIERAVISRSISHVQGGIAKHSLQEHFLCLYSHRKPPPPLLPHRAAPIPLDIRHRCGGTKHRPLLSPEALDPLSPGGRRVVGLRLGYLEPLPPKPKLVEVCGYNINGIVVAMSSESTQEGLRSVEQCQTRVCSLSPRTCRSQNILNKSERYKSTCPGPNDPNPLICTSPSPLPGTMTPLPAEIRHIKPCPASNTTARRPSHNRLATTTTPHPTAAMNTNKQPRARGLIPSTLWRRRRARDATTQTE
ncbi:hypothetical protein Tsubulata_030964 [Turnera subulata]|uniref:Uncharacterized protein n=1 Tax=Turnera subulata TaxID=218843 RepID=A0A9Q0FGY5_9ROSI|nr:hypothetical protein Tsubulata_030964 [Turnera subulata]